jgi:hypothetical protein
MKKIILIAAMALGFVVTAVAQPKAVGLRLGYGAEVTYQHNLGSSNFLEANLGLNDFSTLNLAATYNWMIAKPQWTDRGEWGFYAGPGIALGAGKDIFNVGIAGQVGLEYTFWFPLQLSIDVRPQLGLVGDNFGLWGWYPQLGVRYRF